jgi:vacuolar-type H+-ATPase subunit F/Vma7
MGFGLAGVHLVPCANSEEAVAAVQSLLENRDQGIVIVEEELIADIDPHVKAELLKRPVPLVVPIPGELIWKNTDEVPRDDLIARLIRQAVGYQLNIQF